MDTTTDDISFQSSVPEQSVTEIPMMEKTNSDDDYADNNNDDDDDDDGEILVDSNENINGNNVNNNNNLESMTEFSFGTFWNWFLPSCLDVWSSSTCSSNPEIVIAYGAKSFLFLADVYWQNSKKKSNKTKNNSHKDNQNVKMDREWKIRYRDIVNVFGIKPKSSFFDAFRSNSSYITTVVFDKTFSIIKHGSSSGNQRINSSSAMLFLGNTDGIAALYDCHQRITLLQNLPFSSISKPCCRTVTQKKILSAVWLHFQSEGPVVYYSIDTHIIIWKVKKNKVKVFHDNKQECSNSRFNSSNLQISCLASLPAECTVDKTEHKLAIGFMGGKIVIIGLDPANGHQTSLTIFSENGHNDDICSLSFSSYALSSNSAYRQGLLCSVSRDAMLKVWSCSNQNEIAEHRINLNIKAGTSGSSKSTTNWFSAQFLPRSCKSPNCSYEIVFTNNTGDLLTFTLPEKVLNSKLRIGKVQKTFQPKTKKNELINHSCVVFSITINLERLIAITISLDYKLILWDLTNRTSGDVFYSFSNGALAIDSCLSDKRVAIAFGSNIFVIDFSSIEQETLSKYDVNVQRLTLSAKNAKFYSVIWNRKHFERLGKLIAATSMGELYHYDLNNKSIVFKSNKSNSPDTTKIYNIVWLDFLIPQEIVDEGDKQQNLDEKLLNPVVLTLHQSGNVMVNYLANQQIQENLDKYLVGLPENQKVKRTAITVSNDFQRYLFIGNDDGTVDVFTRIFSEQKPLIEMKAYRHLYRFRPFSRPCLSIEYCSNTKWLAVTALHENYINCYLLEDSVDSNLELEEESEKEIGTKLNVKNITTKCSLIAHQERVSTTCWSPFNKPEETDALLASGSYDTTCIIWNVTKKEALKQFLGHRSIVYSIKWCHFNPDYLFTGGEDNFFFWNWTRQSEYSSTNISNKNDVKIISLKFMLDKNDDNDEEIESNIDGSSKSSSKNKNKQSSISNSSDTASLDKSISSLTSDVSRLSNSCPMNTSSSSSAKPKALFPLNNQIENNSLKHDILDDIKWLIKLKQTEDDSLIPPKKLDRILLYGNSDHIERLLQLEIDNHKNQKNLEGHNVLSLFLNARNFIEQSIENNECDTILAMFSSGFSQKLYSNCIQNILGDRSQNKTPNLNPRIKWNNHGKELSALIRLYCLNDIQSAVDFLLSNKLFREAIIISTLNFASEDFITDLWDQWHQFRLKQNNYEGSIKCLLAIKNYEKALELLEQRKTLCSDVSNPTYIKQYEEIISMIKDNK